MADEGATVDGGNEDLSELLSSATLMLFIGSLGSLSRLIEQVAMGRLLGPDAYGEVSIAFSMMTVSTTLAMFGFKQGIARFITRFEHEADVRGAWRTGVVITVVLTVVVTVGLLANAERLAGRLLEPSTPRALVFVFIATLPLFVGLELAVAGMRGRENTIYRTYTRDLLYNGLRLGLIVGLLVAGYGVVAMGYAYLVATAVSFVVALRLFDRLLPIAGPSRTRVRERPCSHSPSSSPRCRRFCSHRSIR